MISEIFLRDYFSGLAKTSKDIAHSEERKSFFMLRGTDLDEFDAALRNMANPVGLILQIGSGKFGSDDNIRDYPELTFFFVIKTDGSYAELDDARERAKMIGKKFISRMMFDLLQKDLRDDNVDGPLRARRITFDRSGQYTNLGNIGEGENWTGKMLEIKLNGQGDGDYQYNPNDWSA
jgi:hypothetical protein